MNTLSEVKYYCNTQNHSGALMLKGDWGSGKTYFIDNILKKELKDTHIIVRTSLFGITSTRDVHSEVKRNYLLSVSNMNSFLSKSFAQLIYNIGIDTIKDNLSSKYESLSNVINSININEFYQISPSFNNKKVVLVFDDFERSSIPLIDLLGCINELCENQNFHTIIVLNEDKLPLDKENMSYYKQIKEKIVQRTITFIPDINLVLKNIIDEYSDTNEAYHTFLFENKELISSVFLTESKDSMVSDNKPINIRCLKHALNDFERIYEILNRFEIPDINKWMMSFITYSMSYKLGLLSDDSIVPAFHDIPVETQYPGLYNSNYITDNIKNWIETGEWTQDSIENEFKTIREEAYPNTPKGRVRKFSLLDLEENDFLEGFMNLLEDAYLGNIRFADYINLLNNYSLIKKYNIPISDIDLNKLCEGIEYKISKTEVKEDTPFNSFLEEDKAPEVKYLYDKIYNFIDSYSLVTKRNKKIFVDNITSQPIDTLIKLQRSVFNSFDFEFAESTLKGFLSLHNNDKKLYVDLFNNIWSISIENIKGFQYSSSKEAFEYLINQLKAEEEKHNNENLYICKIHDRYFISVLETIIDDLKKDKLL